MKIVYLVNNLCLYINYMYVSFQNEVTIAVPGPFSDYEIVYVNISGVNHSFFHPTPTATYGAMIYGRSSMTGYGFTLGYTLSHRR